MIAAKQIDRMIQKLRRFEKTLEDRLFSPVGRIQFDWYKTAERLHSVPDPSLFSAPEETWGGAGQYVWFAGSFTPGEELAGQRLYILPEGECYEGFLWVNGEPKGIFTRRKPLQQSLGNHYSAMLTMAAKAGDKLDVAIEYYAGTQCAGTQPFEHPGDSFMHKGGGAQICLRDGLICEYLFDLRVLTELYDTLDGESFRRADLIRTFTELFGRLYLDPENVEEALFRERLTETLPLLKEALSRKNSPSAPVAGLIGHSHMDTAWLWTIDETVKKCARTYANQLSLMEQYPEYLFVQSSAYHSEMIRRHYPALFAQIKEKIAEGRYEPNGGVWVECDCNLVSGESLARQFLWGQSYTRTHFGYTADAFWLPDTFGYNAAIPQIMKKSCVDYFLTTKMTWNDQNVFPYDTFYWEGIDGTRVLAHLNRSHLWPDPANLRDYVESGKRHHDPVREKAVSRRRLLAFGYGDGGGGPMFEMLETARRLGDLEGLPKAEYTTVSGFMKKLEDELYRPSVHAGELYLELHRGTLTNQHQIKRNMRKGEIAVHDWEYASVRRALAEGARPDPAPLREAVETLLVNQFHDILPGTCIPEAHRQSIEDMGAMIQKAREGSAALLQGEGDTTLSIHNTLSFARNDVLYIDAPGISAPHVRCQTVDTLLDGKKTAVAGLELTPFASAAFPVVVASSGEESPFVWESQTLTTPHAIVSFADNGTIRSFLDRHAENRELCGEGYPLNTLLLAEDVPLSWDNWDIDADIEMKFTPVSRLVSREVVSEGCVELRIRSVYQISEQSTVTQDMVFYADSPLLRFETRMDWNERHRFLKVAFDTSIQTSSARHEIQFGHISRPSSRNTDGEKAKFEVCCHKYTDLSESRYGAALLNDGKYGISVQGGQMRLSLHKGGQRPDAEGDIGQHDCVYALLPHAGGFSAERVVRPAYCLNYAPLITKGGFALPPLLEISAPTVIAETVKPCEQIQNAYILRLYECEGARAPANITIPGAKQIIETNILEDILEEVPMGDTRRLDFHPFEIKTLLVRV